jgi:beta-galactosidase
VSANPLVPGVDALVYGGDYNPEQWPEDVWHEDVAMMREAGVNLVHVGVFSWALLEPREGEFDFDRFDRVLDLLHGSGVRVGLATPTAAPPAWLLHRYPGMRPVMSDGTTLSGAARQTLCPHSPDYARAAERVTTALAERYGDHPAVALWHIHNEYGGAMPHCYCDTSAAAFRGWLRERHGSLDALNQAWGTAFWGQRYGDWEEIYPPRQAPTVINPALQLDFLRFSNDGHLACYRRERDIVRRHSPGRPVTTNFMIVNCKWIDYWSWAKEVDFVANDHYLQAEEPDNHIELAMAADVTRGVADGRPWLLMEHSTNAVSWQPRNLAKRPGEMRRNSLTHLARGADGAMFFQWRASRSGAEKFHSAMVPHSGRRSRVWGEVVDLGRELGGLDALCGTRVAADTALVWDWQSWWAMELEWRPTRDHTYRERTRAFYTWLWRAHRTVDVVAPDADLTGYRTVVVPSLYLTTSGAADNLTRYVEGGGALVVSYFSGIVDENDTVHAGGYPGALREVLGVEVDEFLPLREGGGVRLDDGTAADVWTERVVPTTAEVVLRYADGPAEGEPAVTRNIYGRGQAWYVSTRLDPEGLAGVLGGLLPPPVVEGLPEGVEAVRRVGDGGAFLTVVNHTGVEAKAAVTGTDVATGERVDGTLAVPAGGVRIVREDES